MILTLTFSLHIKREKNHHNQKTPMMKFHKIVFSFNYFNESVLTLLSFFFHYRPRLLFGIITKEGKSTKHRFRPQIQSLKHPLIHVWFQEEENFRRNCVRRKVLNAIWLIDFRLFIKPHAHCTKRKAKKSDWWIKSLNLNEGFKWHFVMCRHELNGRNKWNKNWFHSKSHEAFHMLVQFSLASLFFGFNLLIKHVAFVTSLSLCNACWMINNYFFLAFDGRALLSRGDSLLMSTRGWNSKCTSTRGEIYLSFVSRGINWI